MTTDQPKIDLRRLRGLLNGINQFGALPDGEGFDRRGYTEADMAARRWFFDQMVADGLEVRMDAVGNVIGRYGPSEGAAVMIGSHLDTVLRGGAFDGALGVATALETVRALKTAGIEPQTAIEVVATAEEEGRFGGMLGAQALVGSVTREWMNNARDADGLALTDVMRAQGLNPSETMRATCPPGSVRAFLELHIEQGPALESRGISVGLVEAISGVCVLQVKMLGAANHSGTTPMHLRADALAGLAEVAAGITALIARVGTDQSRVTIGKLELHPNDVHTIPGRADFSVVLRDTEEAVMQRLLSGFRDMLGDAAIRHNLQVQEEVRSWLAPVELDPALLDIMEREARVLRIPALRMPSGAGHDAQIMQRLCPAGLIFVPSKGGISHAPHESTDWEDIVVAAELFLRIVKRLTKR
ncbi:MAG: Zn-dependent hydrolase [Pseudomonadota bacterium]